MESNAEVASRDRQTLLFSAGELETAVAHLGIVAVWLVQDEIMDIRNTAGGLQLLLGGILLGIEEIIPNGAVEEIRFLCHNADVGAQKAQVIALDVDIVDAHLAAVHIIQARDEIDQRGLA